MFSIGEFARHGRVSVRMLRHYDAIGLLLPAHVDSATGYRTYAAQQLSRLNRIVALKELGFSLAEVRASIDDAVGPDQLRGMLALRRSQLQRQIALDTARLAEVEARLRIIEREGHAPDVEIVLASVPPMRVAELSAVAAGYEPRFITPVIEPLYEQLCALRADAGVRIVGPNVAYYDDGSDGSVLVHACMQLAQDLPAETGVSMRDLPPISAATVLHRGPMSQVAGSMQALATWIDSNGYHATGYAREVYLESPAGRCDEWVTELLEPIAKVSR